jgi:hypothetical protein
VAPRRILRPFSRILEDQIESILDDGMDVSKRILKKVTKNETGFWAGPNDWRHDPSPSVPEEIAMKLTTARALVLVTPLVGLTILAPSAGAGEADQRHGDREVAAHLTPIEGSGVHVSGHAEVEFNHEGQIDEFELRADGLLAGAPHAAHIHFGEQARHECPTLADDTNGDGHLSTTEGAPAYGPIVLSLTTMGDTSPASALAVDRFPTGPGFDYERNGLFETEEGVAEAIAAGKGVVVIHGVDYNDNGMYDFDAGASELDPSLPTEATDPAMCGVLED